MVEIEVWVLVDENGNVSVATDESDLDSSYMDAGAACRKLRLELSVPFAVPTLKGTVPAEGEASLTVG